MVSIIIPAYNEAQMIKKTYMTISNIMNGHQIDAEYVFVNDGSKDDTWNEIDQLGKIHKEVRGVSFSKNFGKEAAILAGMEYALGDCCVVIDADLQHPPEKIVEMYDLWKKGYDVVEGIKNSRGKQNPIHKLFAKIFYHFISEATGIDMRQASDFKLLDRKVVDILLKMPERQTFFRALSSWVGFKSTSIVYDVNERTEGKSKWSAKMLIKYAVNNISSFSSAPMQMVTILGIIFLGFAIVIGIQTLVRYFMGTALDGFTTVIILQLLIGSVIMISLGIIGFYISKIYVEIKARPRYIVENTINDAGDNKQECSNY